MSENPAQDGSQPLAGEVNIYEKTTYTVVKIVLQNPAATPVQVQLRQSLPPGTARAHVTFPSEYHGDNWSYSDGQLEFKTTLAPDELLRTAYGTKAVELDELRTRIEDAIVTVTDEPGAKRGRITGIKPNVVETAEDAQPDDSEPTAGDGSEEAGSVAERVVSAEEIVEATPSTAEDDPDAAGATFFEEPKPADDAAAPDDNAVETEHGADAVETEPADDAEVTPTAEPESSAQEGEIAAQSETAASTEDEPDPQTAADDSSVLSAESIVDNDVEPLSEHLSETDDPLAEATVDPEQESAEADPPDTDQDETPEPESATATTEPVPDTEPEAETEQESAATDSSQSAEPAPTEESPTDFWEQIETDDEQPTADADEPTADEPDQAEPERQDLPANRSDYVLADVDDLDPEEFEWIQLLQPTPDEDADESANRGGVIGWLKSLFR